MIEVKQLTKVFTAGVRAINGLDLAVAEGEIMGLLGPNGAGKTTTVRVLSTLSGFDSGSVKIAGFDIDRDPEKIRQSIGFVAQRTGVDYFLTGRENLRLQGHMYHMSRADIDKRIDELASYFQLTEHLDSVVKTYSGGMQRKLDIATALIHRPKMLYLDEPTLGLDTPSRHSLWQMIRRLNSEQGLSILLTTHYLDEADKLAHRVSIIHQGKIAACDQPQNLKSQIKGEALVLSFAEQNQANQQFGQTLAGLDFIKDQLWEQGKLHLYVENGANAIALVSQQAMQAGIQLTHIALAQPTLDDVFLKYTGSSMEQDGEQEAEPWWAQWAGKGGGGWNKGQWAEQSDPQEGDESSTETAGATQADDWEKWQGSDDQASDGQDGDWQKWQQQRPCEDQAESDDAWPSQASPANNWQQWQNHNNTADQADSKPPSENDWIHWSPADKEQKD